MSRSQPHTKRNPCFCCSRPSSPQHFLLSAEEHSRKGRTRFSTILVTSSPPKFRGDASPPDVNSPPVVPEGATAATPAAAVTPEIAAATAEASAIRATLTLLAPPPSGVAVCTPWTQCSLFYQISNALVDRMKCGPNRSQYVYVYYWPEDSQNTACLSADGQIAASPPPDIPHHMGTISTPHLLGMPTYSLSAVILQASIVVFPSIRASDGCSQIGTTFAGLTTSFASGVLSTIELNNNAYSFNFGDLSCPSADVG